MMVRIRPLARRDLKQHFRYIHQFNPDAAWGFRATVFSTLKQIGRHPGLGHQMGFRRVAGVRSLVVAEEFCRPCRDSFRFRIETHR